MTCLLHARRAQGQNLVTVDLLAFLVDEDQTVGVAIERDTEIAVVFKRPEHQLFGKAETAQLGENALVIRVQPNEGVTIRFGSKVPGPSMQVRDVTMDFGYGHAFTEDSPTFRPDNGAL